MNQVIGGEAGSAEANGSNEAVVLAPGEKLTDEVMKQTLDQIVERKDADALIHLATVNDPTNILNIMIPNLNEQDRQWATSVLWRTWLK